MNAVQRPGMGGEEREFVPEAPREETTARELSQSLDETIGLVERYQAGDEAALGKLFERYYDRVARIVRVKMYADLARKVDAEEVVHSAFAVAMRKFPEFEYREPASLINWLAQIALNKIRDKRKYFEAERRGDGMEVSMEDLGMGGDESGRVEFPGAATQPPERAAREELRLMVDQCLNELPVEYRAVILHRDYEGGSWEHVGRQMGRSPGAARMAHKRAKEALRKVLAKRKLL